MRLLLLTGALAALVYAGCAEPDHDRFCDEAIGCAGGNDLDFEACVATLDFFRENADAQGCIDEYDDFFDCSIEEAECMDIPLGFGCVDDSSCESGAGAGQCINGQCVVKSFSVSDQQVCEAERAAFNNCDNLGTTPFL